jgi:hypothetical protein
VRSDSSIYAEHRGTGIAIFGRGGSNGGEGDFGTTANGKNTNNHITNFNPTNNRALGNPGVTGESSSGTGVLGISHLAAGNDGPIYYHGGAGVVGRCDELRGPTRRNDRGANARLPRRRNGLF